LVQDDPILILPDDSGEIPKPNGVVGSSIPRCESISLLDSKLTRWSKTPRVFQKPKGKSLCKLNPKPKPIPRDLVRYVQIN
jgi:hypothetical protein